MAESIDLFFGMTGDGVVTSRINAMTRSFKGLERGYRTTSQLGKLANMGSKAVQAGSAIGAGRGLVNLLTPENLSLLSRYIIRPIKLDMRKLTRVIKPNFTKITDTISELSKKISAELKLTKIWARGQIIKSAISSKATYMSSLVAGYLGSKYSLVKDYTKDKILKVSSYGKKKAIDFSRYSYRGLQGFVGSKFRESRFKDFMERSDLDKLNKIQSRFLAGLLAKAYGRFKLYTGVGKVGEGFRDRIEKRQEEVFKMVRGILAKVGGNLFVKPLTILNRQISKVSKVVTNIAPVALAFLKNRYVLLAGLFVTAVAAVDRRIGETLNKAISKISNLTSKSVSYIVRSTQLGAQTIAYILKRTIEIPTGLDLGSKYSAPDFTKETIDKMKELGYISPSQIKEHLDRAIEFNKNHVETYIEDFKKNVIDALNKQTEQRLKSIDDLLFTQYRESRI